MSKQVSEQRKRSNMIGNVMMAIGGLLFFSTFITFGINFGKFDFNPGFMIFQSFGGMFLLIAGGVTKSIAMRGLAGSGVVLDPEQARSELEPYSRMAGGMIQDALEEVDLPTGNSSPQQVIMIRCRECGQLNEEGSKFCQECGKPL